MYRDAAVQCSPRAQSTPAQPLCSGSEPPSPARRDPSPVKAGGRSVSGGQVQSGLIRHVSHELTQVCLRYSLLALDARIHIVGMVPCDPGGRQRYCISVWLWCVSVRVMDDLACRHCCNRQRVTSLRTAKPVSTPKMTPPRALLALSRATPGRAREAVGLN